MFLPLILCWKTHMLVVDMLEQRRKKQVCYRDPKQVFQPTSSNSECVVCFPSRVTTASPNYILLPNTPQNTHTFTLLSENIEDLLPSSNTRNLSMNPKDASVFLHYCTFVCFVGLKVVSERFVFVFLSCLLQLRLPISDLFNLWKWVFNATIYFTFKLYLSCLPLMSLGLTA